MEEFNLEIYRSYLILILEVGICSFLLTYFSIPKILEISIIKNLVNSPNERSSHNNDVPHLGGIAIFISIMMCCTIYATELSIYRFLYPSLLILFFVGVVDDLINIEAKKKIFFQIIAAVLLIIGSDVRIKSFFGILGIYELDYLISIFFSIFVFIAVINSYNLIDGIDGLASSVGIIASLAFFYTFSVLKEFSLAILCISLTASLLGFLKHNLSRDNKIFMGDTGSMLIGYLLTFMAIKFINLCTEEYINYKNSPAIAIAILIVPIIDTLSVSVLRILNGESILKADKRHIHHKLINLNFSHLQATITICIFQIIILLVSYFLRHIEINLLLLIIISLGLFFSILPNLFNKLFKN